MIALIIATHGKFSDEIIKSSEMIFGKQENIGCVTFVPGEGLEDLERKYNKELERLNTEDGTLIMVDIFGGSPFNSASSIALKNTNVEIVTGINLPMLLEVYSGRDYLNLEELKKLAKDSGKQGIKFFEESKESIEEEL